jgi:hypothetical protein
MASRAQQQATAAQRRARVLQLRISGATFEQIGQALGITDGRAHQLYKDALNRTIQAPADEHRRLELERLDRLQAEAVRVLRADHIVVQGGEIVRGEDGRPLADHGPTLAAIDRLVRVQESRRKLLGLDAPSRHQVDARVMTVDQMDVRIEELENLLATDDPDYAAEQRHQREREALVERFRAKWSTPGQARRDPLGIVGEGLDLALALLNLSTEEREAVELEVERALMALHP